MSTISIPKQVPMPEKFKLIAEYERYNIYYLPEYDKVDGFRAGYYFRLKFRRGVYYHDDLFGPYETEGHARTIAKANLP